MSLRLRYVKQEELKTVTFRYSEQEAVKRTYAPQGFFSLLGELDNSHFIDVDLNDPFFQQLDIEVDPPASAASIGLLSSHVSVEYVDSNDPTNRQTGDVTFTPEAAKHPFAFYMSPSYDLEYTYTVDYKFDPASGWAGKDLSIELPPTKTTKRYLALDPREAFGFLEVRVQPGDIDAGMVVQSEVHLTYRGTDGWETRAQILVKPDSQPQLWKVRTATPEEMGYEYFCVHHLKDGSQRTSEPVRSYASTVHVSDPFPDYLLPVFIPAFDAASTRHVYIDVTYDDGANNYHRKERRQMLGTDTADLSLRIAILDGEHREFTYRLTFVTSDNQVVQLEPVTTTNEIVAVKR